LVSPDSSLLCECGYDFRSGSGGGRIASAPVLRAALIAAIPMEFFAFNGFIHLLQSPTGLFPSWIETPWGWFALLVHFPVGLLDWHETAQAMVLIVVGYVDSAVLAFLVVAAIRAALSLIKKVRHA
jgi:hypothetical protein